MSEIKKKKLFRIVNFTDNLSDKGKKCIDCVPLKWISSNETGQMTKFMPPSYTPKRCSTLHRLTKNNEDAPSKWPSYPIDILGSAGTYRKALLKMEKLKHDNCVYTTDHTTDIEEGTVQRKGIEKKEQNDIGAVYDLNGKLAKQNNSSSSEKEDSMSDCDSLSDKSSVYGSKRKKLHHNIEKEDSNPKKLSADISTPTHSKVAKNIKSLTSNIATSSHVINYLERILTEVQGFKYDQQLIRNDIQTLKIDLQQYIIKQNVRNTDIHNIVVNWTTENNITWPLKTKEQYDKLNDLLSNEEIRKDFMATIEFIIDSRTPISKNLLAIIRKFLHKDLASKFNCVKVTNDKFTLKPSNFYNCIIEVVMAKSVRGSLQEIISEKALDKLIGVILTNSKDWEKGRAKKINNNVEERLEILQETVEQVEENMIIEKYLDDTINNATVLISHVE